MNPFLEALGTLATVLYATACLPLAWQAVRWGWTPTPKSAAWTFFVANVLFAVYCIASFGMRLPFAMVCVEVVCWGAVLWTIYFSRGPKF